MVSAVWDVPPSHATRAVVPAGTRVNATAGAGTARLPLTGASSRRLGSSGSRATRSADGAAPPAPAGQPRRRGREHERRWREAAAKDPQTVSETGAGAMGQTGGVEGLECR